MDFRKNNCMPPVVYYPNMGTCLPRPCGSYSVSSWTAGLKTKMFILNEHRGTTISLDFPDGDLYTVLSLLADAARREGFFVFVDKRITGKIKITMEEPWNNILVEILAGVNFATVIVNNIIAISLRGKEM